MAAQAFTLQQQLAEARREVRKRRDVYPRLVANSSLTQTRADELIACMEAIATTLQRLVAAEAEHTQPSLFTTAPALVRCEARMPASFPGDVPQPAQPDGQCGLPDGHRGEHTLLIPTGMPWLRSEVKRKAHAGRD